MTEDKVIKDSIFLDPIEISDFDENEPKEIQIMKKGSFKHCLYGDFSISEKDLQEIVKNFEDNVRQIKLAVNFDHVKTKAAGWIESLAIRDNRLFAIVNWTKEAKGQILDGVYKYFSPEIVFKYKDSESGNRFNNVLVGGAITNYPFFKGMEELKASDKEESVTMNKKELLEVLLSEHELDVNLMVEAQKTSEAKVVEMSEANEGLKEKVKELEEYSEKLNQEKFDLEFSKIVQTGMEEGKLTKEFAENELKEMASKMGLEFVGKFINASSKVINTESVGSDKNPKELDCSNAGEFINSKAVELSEKENISVSDAISKVMGKYPEVADSWVKQTSV